MTRKPFILVCCLLGILTVGAHAQAPVADFSATPVSGCGPLAVNFKDLSTNGPIFWTWDFGNGQISHQQNPAMTYATPGSYTVALIVTNKSGLNRIQKTNYITVYPYPGIDFKANTQLACAPAGIQFTDLTNPGTGNITQWKWDFGDGGTSNQQNPLHNYTQPGYYTVALQAVNSGGCANVTASSRYIRVVQGVQPNFNWAQTSNSCSAPFLLNFINQTSGPGNLTYAWNLGNGSTPTQTNPSTSYPASTSYTVNLTAQSDLGCNATIQKTITFAAANAAITSSDSACLNAPVGFQNGSAPAPLSSVWTFGDGNGSTAANPSNTYGTVSTYTVKLVNTYANCTDSIQKNIKVLSAPVAAFTANTTVSCKAPLTVTFTDASTGGAKTWQWNFGDGSPPSTQQSPQHTYNTTGVFDVTLTVSDGLGCSGTITKSGFIVINAPTATLTNGSAGQLCAGGSYSPIATVNAPDGVASYSWSAPGATPSTSTSATPAFTYATAGNYDITLTITTTGGCSVPILFSNAVVVGTHVAPVFSVSNPAPCASQQVIFTSTTTPADGWHWDFGDGNTSHDTPVVMHYYHDTGTFTYNLTAINHGCATPGTPQTIHVNAPIAKFGFKIHCASLLTVDFSDSSIVDQTQVATYVLDYGDGTPTMTVTAPPYPPPLPSHTYAAYGSYPVSLTVTNGACGYTSVKTVSLIPLTPTFQPHPANCRNADFWLNSTTPDSSLIAIYTWTVGPNAPVILDTPSLETHVNTNGPFSIVLTVTDINGCPYSSASPVPITITGPTAQFAPLGTGGCENSPISFTDQSTLYGPPPVPIQTWTWNYGDGQPQQVLTAPPFSHAYADTGLYNITLSIKDNDGCLDSYTFPNPVQITAPHAGFFADTFYCPNEPLPFTDSSRGDNLSWNWDFGDGSTSTIQDPSYSYTTNGQYYSVKLKVTDLVGCSDSLTRTNYIHIQHPIAAFTITDSTTICPPLQTTFTPTSQFYDSLYWDFGDGSTSTLAQTTHFFNTFDTFTVKLILKGPGGCADTAFRRVFVLNPGTTASFTYGPPPLQQCDSLLVQFNIIPTDFTKLILTFGDGQTDTSGNTTPSYLYRSPSTYQPQLDLEDPTGCIVGVPGGGPVIILGATPFFSIDKHAFCDSAILNFTDFTITNDMITSETWFFGNGSSTTQANPSYDYPTPGVYQPTLTVTTQHGCMESYTDTVREYQTPHPFFSFSSQPCATKPIQFMGAVVQPDPDSVSWAWDFGNGQTSDQQDPTITFPQPGQYLIRLKTAIPFGCSDTTSQVLGLHLLPSIKGPGEITIPVGLATPIPFTYSTGIVSYVWTPAANLSCTDCPDPLASPIFNTEYTIVVTDTNNCSRTDSLLVKTVCNGKNYFIPNTFSPNGDGVNDVFYPRGNALYNIQSMRIFNRWGQIVFEKRDFPANSPAGGWDGTFNGRPAAVDVYVYVVEVVCENAQVIALNGNVTLVR